MLSRGGGVRRPPVTKSPPIKLQGHPAAGLIWAASGRFAFAFDSCDSFAGCCDDNGALCTRVSALVGGHQSNSARAVDRELGVREEMSMADASARVQPQDSI